MTDNRITTKPSVVRADRKRAIATLQRSRTPLWIFAVLCLSHVLAACAQTKSCVHDAVPAKPQGSVQILLVEPDVEVAELTAAGLLIPHAEWTQRAQGNINAALSGLMTQKQAQLVLYEPPDGLAADHPHTQLLKLHSAVGQAILTHKYTPGFDLPTKQDKFDWSLGSDVQTLRDVYDADYALFIFFRDSFSTGGRVALIMAAAVFGVGVPGGQQVGFASLVDLNTGNILWFNTLASGFGDLREPDSAEEATEALFDEIPL